LSETLLDRFDPILLAVNRWAIVLVLAAMAMMVFANVVLRFGTSHFILWVEEVSRYLISGSLSLDVDSCCVTAAISE